MISYILISEGNAKLFSKLTVSLENHASNVYVIWFIQTLVTIWFYHSIWFFILAILIGIKRHLIVVLICIVLITYNAEIFSSAYLYIISLFNYRGREYKLFFYVSNCFIGLIQTWKYYSFSLKLLSHAISISTLMKICFPI